MGNVSYLAHSNQFWVSNLNEFKQGLKGYVGGEWESEVAFNYTDFKRRSKNALISMSSGDFAEVVYKREDSEDALHLLEYIKNHIKEGEQAVIHFVAYEHAQDMSITKYVIDSESVQTIELLNS